MNAPLRNMPLDTATLFAEEVADLLLEARNYLDGEPIANDEQAEAVSSLLNRARRVGNDADDARKAEKKPHDDAGKAVQVRWKPILDDCTRAADVAKQALAPWLQAVEARQREEAAAKEAEATALAQQAQQALAGSVGDILARADAERLLKEAADAQKGATKAGKRKALATGGERAVGLVDRFTPELTDSCAALKHYRATQPTALKEWLLEQARKDVHSGVRAIPGFTINHDRVAR